MQSSKSNILDKRSRGNAGRVWRQHDLKTKKLTQHKHRKSTETLTDIQQENTKRSLAFRIIPVPADFFTWKNALAVTPSKWKKIRQFLDPKMQLFLHYFKLETLRMFQVFNLKMKKSEETKTSEQSGLEPETIRSRMFGLFTWAICELMNAGA